jgi:cephalosporin hydroxylase
MGWTLTALASFVPLLISEQGILWILGQSLIYSASVFGISAYFKSETVQLKRDMDKHLERMERMQRIRFAKGEDVDELPDEE